MDDDDGGNAAFYVDYARQTRAGLERMLDELERLAPDRSSAQTATEDFLFQDAKLDAKASILRLFELVDRVEPAMERGDTFYYLNDLVDAVFYMGIGLGSTDQARRHAAKAIQKRRGQESGKRRREKQGLWQAHCDELMAKIEATNPSLPAEELAQRIRSKWSCSGIDMPAHSTVATYVKRKRREPQDR